MVFTCSSFTRTNVSYRPAAPPAPLTGRSSTIVTVPKSGPVNLAVMQQVQAGSKMTVLQAPPGTQKIITTGPAANIQAQVCCPCFFSHQLKFAPLSASPVSHSVDFILAKTHKVKVGYSPTANQIRADLAALQANL